MAALDLYARLLRQYAPPGVVNFNWYECSASFMQGQVAIYMDGVNFASQFEDAAKSKVVGKVGYAMLPSGPGGHFSPIYITGMAVSSQSRSKEATYLRAVGHQQDERGARAHGGRRRGGRTSTWDSPEVKAKPKMPADWYQAYQASLKIGRQGLPEIVGRHRVPRHHRRGDPEGDRGSADRPGRRPGAEGVPGHAHPDRDIAPTGALVFPI